MASQGRLQGIFTPHMVPLDLQGQIDEGELRRYVDWLIRSGVHGLYPNGSTGEFLRFTPAERRRIIEIVMDEAASRVPVLAGAAEANVRETLAACEHYHGLGVRAVAIVAPHYYKLSPDNVYAYFKEIARHTPVDVTLYNIPMFASPIDVVTIQRLAEECPRIIALKDSSGDVAQMVRMIEAVRPRRPDFSFLTGWDTVLMPMLLVGCDGGTNASSGFVPELTRKLYESTTAGRLAEARRLQARVIALFDAALTGADFPEGFRTAAQLRGFRMGIGRQPLSQQHSERLARLEKTLGTLLAEEELVPVPPSVTPAAGWDPQQIGRIVEGVLSALEQRGVVGRGMQNAE